MSECVFFIARSGRWMSPKKPITRRPPTKPSAPCPSQPLETHWSSSTVRPPCSCASCLPSLTPVSCYVHRFSHLKWTFYKQWLSHRYRILRWSHHHPLRCHGTRVLLNDGYWSLGHSDRTTSSNAGLDLRTTHRKFQPAVARPPAASALPSSDNEDGDFQVISWNKKSEELGPEISSCTFHHRLVPNGNAKAGLQYSVLMLTSVYSALRSMLRPPPELFNQERAPADSLTGIYGALVQVRIRRKTNATPLF